MKYDIKIINEYISKNLLIVQSHPTLPLKIYKYSHECVFSKAWDDITLNMRGTVLDLDGNQISNPIPKFFNLGELDQYGITIPNTSYTVTEKLDGSLIQIFKYKDQIVITSSGSFTSDYVLTAHKIINEKYPNLLNNILPNKTYLFEIIF